MALTTKADYKYITVNEDVPEFTGQNLVPSENTPIRIETLCHIAEELAERAALLYMDAWAPQVFPANWPSPLYGWQLGRCQAMWDNDSTKGLVSGVRPLNGGTGGRGFNGLVAVAPAVAGTISSESDLIALYPSSATFPAQTYSGQEDDYESVSEPYRTAVGGNRLYRIDEHGIGDSSDFVHDAIGLVYGFETTGLTRLVCGRHSFDAMSESEKDKIRMSLQTMFGSSNGKYMAYMVTNLPSGTIEGIVNAVRLLWNGSTSRFYISGSATVPSVGTGFQICGGYATYSLDTSSNPFGVEVEDDQHPLSVLSGSTSQVTDTTDTLLGTSLAGCMDALYPLSEKPNQVERTRIAVALVGLLHPGISGYSIHVETPSGGLARRVFGNGLISPQAVVYADNLLAKCERVLVADMSLSADDGSGNPLSGRTYYNLQCSGSFFSDLVLSSATKATLPTGYYVEAGEYKQDEQEFWCGNKSGLVWSGRTGDITSPIVLASRTETSVPSAGYVTLGSTLGSYPMTGTEFSNCVVGLWFSASVTGRGYSLGQTMGRNIEIEEQEVETPSGTFQYEEYHNVNVCFPGCSSNSVTWERRPFVSRSAKANFFMWVSGSIRVESSAIRVRLTLPSKNNLVSMANSSVSGGSNPFTIPDFTGSESDIRDEMLAFVQDSLNDVMSAQGASWTLSGDTEDPAPVPQGPYGSAIANFNYELEFKLLNVGPVFYRVTPRSGTLQNP